MAKRKSEINLEDEAVRRILSALLTEFKERGLSASDLHEGYEGLSPADLKTMCLADGPVTEVDYDLAMKNLDEFELLDTGPMVPFENDPNSSVVIIAMYSKNEFTYLTEAGYKAATKLKIVKPPRPYMPNVQFSGTFHNSNVGVGQNVSQTLHLEQATGAQLFELLRSETKKQVADETKQEAILSKIDHLEIADKPSKMERYAQLVGVLGDHITVLGFILPHLLQRIL